MFDRSRYTVEYDDEFCWKRVGRNLGWLGNTEAEQRQRQCRLRDAVIGVAGCGGIGSATADRLVRMGVRNLKLADPDTFDVSNINRQFGASVDTVGANKAEVVAELVYNTHPGRQHRGPPRRNQHRQTRRQRRILLRLRLCARQDRVV